MALVGGLRQLLSRCCPQTRWAVSQGGPKGLYKQCFTNMSLYAEGWCKFCQAIDHTLETCPSRNQLASCKRPGINTWQAALTGAPRKISSTPPACIKFNGNYKFRKPCPYQHVCSKFAGAHPVNRCPEATAGAPEVKAPKLE